MENRKRITMILEKPNPLFERWLTEWRDDARQRGSKMEFTFKIALDNLKKYKLPLKSGQECKILKGFGDKLCKMLDDNLKTYQKNKELGIPDLPNPENNVGKLKRKSPNVKLLRKNSNYIPQHGSGSYAILVAIYESNFGMEPGCVALTKNEIIEIAKHKSNFSFTKPDLGTRYTAWSSMRTLLQKGLITKESHPPKYRLTQEGYKLAESLIQNCDSNEKPTNITNIENDILKNIQCFNENTLKTYDIPDDHDDIPKTFHSSKTYDDIPSIHNDVAKTSYDTLTILNREDRDEISSLSTISKESAPKKGKTLLKHASSSSITSTQSSAEEECFIFEPDSFNIILLVDTQETASSSANLEEDILQRELQRLSVNYEVRHLTVGDYVWICRHKINNKELVLPYIIERKRLDDFAQSIKDGRYYEQKFRLEKSGIQNITYLIENIGNKYIGLPLATLQQAAINTAIQDGFNVKYTSNIRHTAKHLDNFTKLITINYSSKTLVSCPKNDLAVISVEDDLVSLMTFKDFNRSSIKNKPLTVSDLFIKMLIQINGMSVDRAMAIIEKYPTPLCLRQAYIENTGKKGEQLLANIKFGNLNKNIGNVLSKIVYDLFTKETFNT